MIRRPQRSTRTDTLCPYPKRFRSETGAIGAALTTSIPEAPNSGRNWDYRLCWIRDAYYTVQALNRLGALDVLAKYLAYLRTIVHRAACGHLPPLYAVMGVTGLDEPAPAKPAGYPSRGPGRCHTAGGPRLQADVNGKTVLPNCQ